jgi:hypothetical protein
MTADKFRTLALAIPGAVEGAHMGHADFRVQGKIFATLGYPDENFGMVKLSPAQQQLFIKKAPTAFAPCAGAWGKKGSTSVCLARAKAAELREMLASANELLVEKINAGPTRKTPRK